MCLSKTLTGTPPSSANATVVVALGAYALFPIVAIAVAIVVISLLAVCLSLC